MNTLQNNDLRVERHILPRLVRLRQLITLVVTDPRRPQGTRFPIDSMLLALLAGLLAGCRALRDVERQTLRLGLGRRGGKISGVAYAQKRGRKRMSTVAAVYTVAPNVRTGQDLIAGLRHIRDAVKKPGPHRRAPAPARRGVGAAAALAAVERRLRRVLAVSRAGRGALQPCVTLRRRQSAEGRDADEESQLADRQVRWAWRRSKGAAPISQSAPVSAEAKPLFAAVRPSTRVPDAGFNQPTRPYRFTIQSMQATANGDACFVARS